MNATCVKQQSSIMDADIGSEAEYTLLPVVLRIPLDEEKYAWSITAMKARRGKAQPQLPHIGPFSPTGQIIRHLKYTAQLYNPCATISSGIQRSLLISWSFNTRLISAFLVPASSQLLSTLKFCLNRQNGSW